MTEPNDGAQEGTDAPHPVVDLGAGEPIKIDLARSMRPGPVVALGAVAFLTVVAVASTAATIFHGTATPPFEVGQPYPTANKSDASPAPTQTMLTMASVAPGAALREATSATTTWARPGTTTTTNAPETATAPTETATAPPATRPRTPTSGPSPTTTTTAPPATTTTRPGTPTGSPSPTRPATTATTTAHHKGTPGNPRRANP